MTNAFIPLGKAALGVYKCYIIMKKFFIFLSLTAFIRANDIWYKHSAIKFHLLIKSYKLPGVILFFKYNLYWIQTTKVYPKLYFSDRIVICISPFFYKQRQRLIGSESPQRRGKGRRRGINFIYQIKRMARSFFTALRTLSLLLIIIPADILCELHYASSCTCNALTAV